MYVDLKKPIPIEKLGDCSHIDFDDSIADEPMINLYDFDSKIILCPVYAMHGIKDTVPTCYVRKSVADRLKIAADLLPDDIMIKVLDGWRPKSVQKVLWNNYMDFLKSDAKNDALSDSELEALCMKYVSKPSGDIRSPFPHNTGGCVDVSLVYDDGIELNFGTLFNDFTEMSQTAFYETSSINCRQSVFEEIRDNRRLLYNAMIGAGFTNLPNEWWHYDFGTKYWAYFMNCKRLYNGVDFVI